MKEKTSKNKLLILVVLLLLLVTGITYSWLTLTRSTNTVNKITAGTLELSLDESTTNGITLANAIPMSYQKGITTEEYTFTLKNTGTIDASYKLSLNDLDEFVNNNETVQITNQNRLADNYIRYILIKGNESKEPSKSKLLSELSDRVIDEGNISGNS